jgi:TRAP-type C4-dicarboxylate transport system substrate-binding protein
MCNFNIMVIQEIDYLGIVKKQKEEKMKTKRYHSFGILGVILMSVIFLVIMVTSPGKAAERKEILLRAAAGHPCVEACYWVTGLEKFFCPEVEKRVHERTSKYKVVIKPFSGGAVAKHGEILESVQRGIVDIGIPVHVFEMSKLEPFNFTWWIPFSTNDTEKVLRSYIKTINHFSVFEKLLARYNQRRIGHSWWPQSTFQLATDFPIKTIDDLKGKKLAHGGPFLPWLAALGATSVQAPYSEVYTSVDTGVFNGFSMPANVAASLKIYEVAPYFTEVNFLANVTGNLTINLDTWKRLPEEVQKILDDVGDEYAWHLNDRRKFLEAKAYETMKKAGVKVHRLSQKEQARWAKVLDDARVAAKAITACKNNGFPAVDIARFYIKTLTEDEGCKFPYPPTLELK